MCQWIQLVLMLPLYWQTLPVFEHFPNKQIDFFPQSATSLCQSFRKDLIVFYSIELEAARADFVELGLYFIPDHQKLLWSHPQKLSNCCLVVCLNWKQDVVHRFYNTYHVQFEFSAWPVCCGGYASEVLMQIWSSPAFLFVGQRPCSSCGSLTS